MSGETRAGVYGSRMATRGRSADDSGGSGDGRPSAGWQAKACPTIAEPHAEACPTLFMEDRPGGLSHLAPSFRDFQKASAVRSFSGAPKPALWMASARSRSAVVADRPARSEEHTAELQALR